MAQEIEFKFSVKNFSRVKRILRANKVRLIQKRTLEKNYRFDTPDKTMRRTKSCLRVRVSKNNEFAYKRVISRSKTKKEEELQARISDPEMMKTILKELGYEVDWIYEKYREIWRYNDTDVCLDELPMGKYVEIEGKEADIIRVALELGFSPKNAIVRGYSHLFREHLEKTGGEWKDLKFKR